MNTQKKVFEKLFSNEKVELSSQKYEFAKKATSILSEIKKADDTLRKAESKINSIYLTYKKAYNEFQSAVDSSVNSANLAEKDLLAIMDGLTALGLNSSDAKNIDGFSEAADLQTKIKQMAPGFKSLYPKPE